MAVAKSRVEALDGDGSKMRLEGGEIALEERAKDSDRTTFVVPGIINAREPTRKVTSIRKAVISRDLD